MRTSASTSVTSPEATQAPPAPAAEPRARGRWWRRPATLLAVVALAHGLAPLLLMGPGWALGVDEAIYLSQLNSHVPPMFFSAPRARGSTLLAAPVTLLTPSVAAVRLWSSALSAVGLYLAFRPWLRLRDAPRVPVAALLFSTLWPVLFYGFQLMPNPWVAYAALACVGHATLFVTEGRGRHVVGAGVALAMAALLRPSDAVFTGVGVALSLVIVRAPLRRGLQALGVLVLGGAAGCAQWAVEAHLRWGGVASRAASAQTQNGADAWVFTGWLHAAVLKGQQLCLQGCQVSVDLRYVWWWVALGLLVVVGLVHAWRRRALRAELVPLVVGLLVAGQYLFTVQIVAPRFLLPAYALLALPAATGARALVGLAPAGFLRASVAVVLVAVLVGHTALQVSVLTGGVIPRRRDADLRVAAAAEALRGQGLGHPCRVVDVPPGMTRLFYALGCATQPRDPSPAALSQELEQGSTVLWFRARPPAPTGSIAWRPVEVMGEPAGPRARHRGYLSVRS